MPSPAITGYASWARADDDLVAVPPVEGVNLQVGQGENRALVVVEASTQDFSGVQRQNVTVQGVTVPFIQATDSAVDRGQTSLHAISGPAYDVIETEGAQTVPVIAQQISGHENLFKYVALALSNVDTAALTSNVVIFEGSQFSDTIVFDPATYEAGDLVVVVANYTQDRIWTVGDNGLTLVTESASGTDAASSLGVFQKFATQDETNIVHTVTYDKGSTQGGAASANGNRKTGMLLVFKGVEGAADPLFAPVDFELGSTATVTQQAGSFDFDNAATHLVIELPTAAEISIPLTTGTTTGGTLDTVEADLDGVLNQINIDTTYTARLEVRTGATVDELSQDFDFQMTTSASTAYFWGGISVADLQADTSITPAGVASDSAALSVQMKAQVPAADLQAGDTLWYQGPGAVTPTSLLESLPAGAVVGEYREFYQATQAWSEVLPVGVSEFVFVPPTTTVRGDTIEGFAATPDGNYTWGPEWTNFDSVQWEASGGELKIQGAAVTPLSRIIRNDLVINADVISSEVLITPNSQDHMSAGIAQDDGTTIYAKNAGGGRLDLFIVTSAGVQQGLKQATLPANLPTPAKLKIEWSNVDRAASVIVDDIKLLTDTNSPQLVGFNPTRGAIVAVGENTNTATLREWAMTGVTATVIRALNNSVAEPDIRIGETVIVDWTNNNNIGTYRLTDERGNTTNVAATPLSANQDQFTLNIPSFWHGEIILDDLAGNARNFRYIPPVGFEFVNLEASIDLTGNTANWSPLSQIRYRSQSNQANQATISTRGIINIGGGFGQYVETEENPGAGYEASQNDYIFQTITEDYTPIPDRDVISGQAITINLGASFNTTISLPTSEVGTVGALTITDTLPAGLTRTGTMITGTLPNGVYSLLISVVDPAGAVQADMFDIRVGQAGINAINVGSVMPVSAVITADVDSFSGSGTYSLFAVAIPSGDTRPSDAQIAAGQDSTGAPVPNNSVSAPSGIAGITLSGLTPSTAYQIEYLVLASNGESTGGTLAATTTAPAATPFAGSRGKKSSQSRIASNRKRNSRR